MRTNKVNFLEQAAALPFNFYSTHTHTHTHTHTCISSLLPCFGFEKQWGERLESWWVNVSGIICSLIYGYILYTYILNICIATIFRVWGQFCATLLEEVHLHLYTSSSTILFVLWVPQGVLHMSKNWVEFGPLNDAKL